ncbi:MAG: NADPH-dependent glutamate synthase [Verrucomicrobiota bacterium]
MTKKRIGSRKQVSVHPTKKELTGQARCKLDEFAKLSEPLKPKDRLKIPAQSMPAQDPAVRRGNIEEVALGYSPEQARLEALRCLQCKNAPCIEGCPVRIDIPAFVRAMAEGHVKQAIDIIKLNSLLPSVCGRVCPQEVQCQAPCTVGRTLKDVGQAVSIGRLERFAADWERAQGAPDIPPVKPPTGKKVAVIGSGPAGITVAADVRREGHAVTLFEAFHKTGGVMVYGIPEFRLPKSIVQEEIDTLIAMGVRVVTNFVVGRTRALRDLLDKDGFDAVFIGTGAGLPKFMNIEGENLVGVFSANEYLTRANLMRAYDFGHAQTPIFRSHKVAVLGGGNVAMDSARMALRLGAEEVHLVYRRTEVEMPARVEEVEHAKEEGIMFHLLQNAKRILGNDQGCVTGMECLKYQLGEPDASGRRRPVEIPGSEFVMPVDTVIVAIGNESNPLIKQTTTGLETDKWGHIIVDADGKTSLDHVYAGGDIVLGAATVILAMGEGRRAAASINRLLAER